MKDYREYYRVWRATHKEWIKEYERARRHKKYDRQRKSAANHRWYIRHRDEHLENMSRRIRCRGSYLALVGMTRKQRLKFYQELAEEAAIGKTERSRSARR